ncbi:hypothetical protein [Paraburkholderia sp.]|uniref:hypothetical protein n=1 Tax=Paraburkholderia sp. TaxID=1926495 RepID=UPI00286F784C|nr:hypothetical protein [Paraburkholderia sp.]
MTVDFAPVRPLWRSAPRKRLSLPEALMAHIAHNVHIAHMTRVTRTRRRACAVTFVCAMTVSALSACGDRAADARVSLTSSAARELAVVQPAATQGQTPAPSAAAFAPDSDSTSSNSVGSDDSTAALTAAAVRSPAQPAANDGTQSAQNAPLAPPEIHTAD